MPFHLKRVRFQDGVQLVVGAPVEGHNGPGPEDALVAPEKFGRRQGPEEGCQAFDVASLVQGVAHALHLGATSGWLQEGAGGVLEKGVFAGSTAAGYSCVGVGPWKLRLVS